MIAPGLGRACGEAVWGRGVVSRGGFMQRLNVPDLMGVTRLGEMSALLGAADAAQRGTVLTVARAKHLGSIVSDARKALEEFGLPLSAMQADRLARGLSSGAMLDAGRASRSFEELMSRVSDEFRAHLLFQIDAQKASYYAKQDPFGPEVTARFPEVGHDLDEAYKCYALDRYTAAVFHVMRVLEVGVRRLGDDLGIPKAPRLTWGNLTRKCHEKLKVMPQGKEKEKRREAVNHLDGVREVWRNTTMHPRPSAYTEDEATDIIHNAKALMVSLASFL